MAAAPSEKPATPLAAGGSALRRMRAKGRITQKEVEGMPERRITRDSRRIAARTDGCESGHGRDRLATAKNRRKPAKPAGAAPIRLPRKGVLRPLPSSRRENAIRFSDQAGA
ncbi:hypothetical protein [Bosea sp. NPDC055594]